MLSRWLVPLIVLGIVATPIVYAVYSNERTALRAATQVSERAQVRPYEIADTIQTGTLYAQAPTTTQDTAPAAAAPSQPPADPPRAAAGVDESALRYFAAQGDIKRMEAEIARLKRLHPEWVPPRNVDELLSGSDPQTQFLWDLLSDGNYAAAREEIAKRQESDPGWQPPDSLLNALDMAEARQRIANAATSQQWRTVLATAQAYPDLLVCAEMSTLWNIGEAYAQTDQENRAVDLYSYILTNCNDPAERLSTIQKASALLPPDDVSRLLDFERPGPGGEGEFEAVRMDLLRDRVGAAAENGEPDISREELELLASVARSEESATDATLLGFYYYSRNDAEAAVPWFSDAMDWGGDAKAAEGYVLALADTGDRQQAAVVAEEWRDASEANAKAYIDVLTSLLTDDPPPRLEADMVADFAAFVSRARNATGAQGLGFYALNTDQTATAERWFDAALEWDPDEDRAAFGLAIVYQRNKDSKALAALIEEWAPRSDAIAALATSDRVARTSSASTARGGGSGGAVYSGPVNCARAAPDPRSLAAGTALAFAWCLMELDRPIVAVPYFERAIAAGDAKTASDASYGKSLAFLRKGMTGEAAAASTQAAQTPARAVELQTEIITQRALAAYDRGQYALTLTLLDQRRQIAPEVVDLLVIRGWCYYRLGQYDSAKRMFRAAVDSGRVGPGTEGLNAIDERLGVIIPGG
ncbi:hypothetical protein [Microbaculum marinum]|uniref:Tetratricopeptide repeat protein n=1 Tax=Microbaculum marinum TaxID=1764581 RepID=A0AAW9RP58_9HYPH